LTNRIIALSRERYTQEKAVVEAMVRKNAGLEMDNLPQAQQQPPQVKPKVQAQLNQLDKISQSPAATHGHIGKFATGGAGSSDRQPPSPSQNHDQPHQTQQPQSHQASDPSETRPKRRRGKRGGKKNRAGSSQDHIIQPTNQNADEQVIHLR
jgi:hypothetical protein